MRVCEGGGKRGCGFSNFLSDVLLISACYLFLLSIPAPFLTVPYYSRRWGYVPVITEFTVTYWSYKAVVANGIESKAFFGNYWLSPSDSRVGFIGVSWFLAGIFLLQVLTLISGSISLFKKRKARIIPFVSSLSTLILMVQVYVQADKWTLALIEYESGYWLIYPSMFLFLLASILIQRTHACRTEKKGGLREISPVVRGSSMALGTNNIACVRKISIIL